MKASTFLELLTLLFIGLKLSGHIDWSWWAVLAPIWGWIVIVLVVAFIVAFVEVMKEQKEKRKSGKGDGEGRVES